VAGDKGGVFGWVLRRDHQHTHGRGRALEERAPPRDRCREGLAEGRLADLGIRDQKAEHTEVGKESMNEFWDTLRVECSAFGDDSRRVSESVCGESPRCRSLLGDVVPRVTMKGRQAVA
jgi:hypothetical protein